MHPRRAQFDSTDLDQAASRRRFLRKLAKHRSLRHFKSAQRGIHTPKNQTRNVRRYLLSDKPLNYDIYLKSPYWLALRKEVLVKRSVCEDCGTSRRLNLHHLYYYKNGKSVLYRERQYTDIFAVLCFDCHMKRHNVCSPAVLGAQPSTKASTPS